jgi:anti-sigma B factor antagonist
MAAETVRVESCAGKHAGQLILRVYGSLHMSTAATFLDLVRAAEVVPIVILDLTDVHRCDSIGVGALLKLRKAFELEGRRLALAGLNDRLTLLLDVAQVKQFFDVFPSPAEAEERLT